MMAEIFLHDLKPLLILTSDTGYDYFLGFKTASGVMVTIAVELKATEKPVRDHYTLIASRSRLSALTRSNIPILFLVADVKQNELFFTWAYKIRADQASILGGNARVQVPVTKLDDDAKADARTAIEAIGAFTAINRMGANEHA
jgi:hypothetical protein